MKLSRVGHVTFSKGMLVAYFFFFFFVFSFRQAPGR